MYNELIDALRNCSNEAIEMCPPCKYFAWDKPKDDCKFEMMRDAADAIEKLWKEIVELEARISSLEYELAEAYCN